MLLNIAIRLSRLVLECHSSLPTHLPSIHTPLTMVLATYREGISPCTHTHTLSRTHTPHSTHTKHTQSDAIWVPLSLVTSVVSWSRHSPSGQYPVPLTIMTAQEGGKHSQSWFDEHPVGMSSAAWRFSVYLECRRWATCGKLETEKKTVAENYRSLNTQWPRRGPGTSCPAPRWEIVAWCTLSSQLEYLYHWHIRTAGVQRLSFREVVGCQVSTSSSTANI